MSYGFFAEYYDLLTRNVNYAGYARRVDTLIKQYRPSTSTILEIACGTASLGIELSKLGYAVMGADISEDMIRMALEKQRRIIGDNVSFPLFVQDMRNLSLTSAEAVVCSLDALNHLNSLDDIKRCFLSVRKHLLNGGLFIFDMNTPYKHKHILGDNSFVYDEPEVYAVWQNRFIGEDNEVDMTLDFFSKKGGEYERHTENIREKAYRKSVILSALRSCGFEALETFDELKTYPPRYDTERILYIARRI